MRPVAMITSLVLGLALSVAAAAPTARADDYFGYRDTSFVVESAQMSSRDVTVRRLGTIPVTVTMTTRDVPDVNDREGAMPEPAQPDSTLQVLGGPHIDSGQVSTLKRVEGEGPRNTWRGVIHIAGPARTMTFLGLRRCEVAAPNCRFIHDYQLPSIKVRAVQTPVIHLDRVPTVDLRARTYVVSGRVLTSAGSSFGHRVSVVISRNRQCIVSYEWATPEVGGIVVRTGVDGRFRAVLDNRPDISANAGAPVAQDHCVRMRSGVSDPAGGDVFLTDRRLTLPWRASLTVKAPTTIRRGQPVRIQSSAPLPNLTSILLERLHGRTAWRSVTTGSYVGGSGRIQVEGRADLLGRYLYRLRTEDSQAISKPFYMVTVR